MEIIVLFLVLFVFGFLYRKGLNQIYSSLGHNIGQKHLMNGFGVDIDKKEN